ncbi:hypothetical protein NPIL_58541 [Nephila pilipes]|uniref:Uncharacterized protein n=1 Tax=Nephila pilipes TaxID=299642 RepID=A0A8X6TZT3_NEPPI|nr:hypothetical protein NPIL_58541 [Nephila pilipes]
MRFRRMRTISYSEHRTGMQPQLKQLVIRNNLKFYNMEKQYGGFLQLKIDHGKKKRSTTFEDQKIRSNRGQIWFLHLQTLAGHNRMAFTPWAALSAVYAPDVHHPFHPGFRDEEICKT